MSKYENSNTSWQNDVIDVYLDPMEYVFWRGKGKKLPYIINSGAALAPFAILWLLVDSTIIMSMVGAGFYGGGMPSQMLLFMIPFFAIHMMPVWIWIGMMVKGAKKWGESMYVITDRQILVKDKASGMRVQSYKYDKIVTVNVHRGFLDKLMGVSDLRFSLVDGGQVAILDIENAQEIYPRVKQRIEETPCVREMHTESGAGQREKHVCKDYPENYNPYE